MYVFVLAAENFVGLDGGAGDEVVGAFRSIDSATVSVIVRSRALGDDTLRMSFVDVGDVNIMLTFKLEFLGLDGRVLVVEHFVGALSLPHGDHQAGQLIVC